MRRHRLIPLLGIALTLALVAGGGAAAGELIDRQFQKRGYPGSRDRTYQVFVPEGYREGEPVPLVMVLHGCKQTHENMVRETNFRALADRDTFIVVYPFITSFEGFRNPNCWGFWFPEEIHEGAGEVEDLHQIAREVEAAFTIDPNRRYITGLSSGGGMSVAAAVAHSEYFAAAGAAAGLPYGETSSSVGFVCANPGSFQPAAAAVAAMRAEQGDPEEQRPIPFMVVQSNHDCTVNRRAAELIRDSWLARYGAPSTPFATRDCTHEGVACEHRLYGAPARSVVETVFYEGERGAAFTGAGSHYWVGDNQGEFANPRGPSASELFWDFFRRHPFGDNPPPVVTLSARVVDGATIVAEGTATDENGTVTAVRVQLDGTHPQPARAAEGTEAWTVTFPDLADGVYVPLAEAEDDGGAVGRTRGEALRVGEVPPNARPTVSIEDVALDGTCLTVTGQAADEDGEVVAVEVALAERGFRPATYPAGMDGRRYRYRECDLPGGSYTTAVRATDDQGAETLVAGPVGEIPSLESATANWQGHMAAGRLTVYLSPCPSVGFGFCDAPFAAVFLKFGNGAFPAYRAPGGASWYLDPSGIVDAAPRSRLRADAPSLSSAQAEAGVGNCLIVSGVARPGVSLAEVQVRIDDAEPRSASVAGAAWALDRCDLPEPPERVRVTVRDGMHPAREQTLELRLNAAR